MALLVLAVGACRPLYLPPIPEDVPYEPGVRVATFTAEPDASGRPALEVVLTGVEAAGWLNVQWMAPNGTEAASEAVWLEPADPEARFVLPADVEPVAGEWRAVVSFGPRLLRQFRFDLE